MNEPGPASTSFSVARVLLLATPLAVALFLGNRMYNQAVQQSAVADLERVTTERLFGVNFRSQERLASRYADADGDLLADPPADAAQLADPAQLKFSFFATAGAQDDDETWKEFLIALGEKTGKTVSLVRYADVSEQQRALRDGELHVTAFATGDVQGAVNEAGFIPVACLADGDGKYSYTMKIIVPADSELKTAADLKPTGSADELRKRRFTFVRPGSNSGCTAALVMLMQEHRLQPERDYNWGFSFGHENSIDGIVHKQFEAAAVASDILQRQIAAGQVDAAAVREIYESEPYPPGVVGYAYNLAPALRDAIRATLQEFSFAGTGLEKAFGGSGAVKFAPASYKEDWQSVREVHQRGVEILDEMDRGT